MLTGQVHAQTTDPYQNTNVPYGSPVPSQTASQAQSGQGQNPYATQPQSQIQPMEITDPSQQQRALLVDANGNPIVTDQNQQALLSREETRIKAPAKPNEFEQHVQRVLGRRLPRFGADLIVPATRDFAVPPTATVPPDYILGPGDVVSISLTGSVDGSVDLEIDNDGKVFLPKVGAIQLAGVRYADLKDRIARAVGRQYRGYDVTVGIKKLRGIRVYVTGFANNPGAFTVSSLSTMVNAVFAAGGPSSGGSFRSVKLYRRGQLVSDFDLYDLVRNGDRSKDVVLQNEDVLFIPPLGDQVAVAGSVNAEAIYEAKSGETIEQLLRFAGGPNAMADKSRVMLYRFSELNGIIGQQVGRDESTTMVARGGDVLQIVSEGTLQRPVERQSVLVRIEGEVNAPGNYYVPPNTQLADVLTRAGGLTGKAFIYGTRLERLSVKEQQRAGFKDAIQQLEVAVAAAPLSSDASVSGDDRKTQTDAARAVLEQLKLAEPDGRVVLDLPYGAAALPGSLTLENADRIVVPPRPSTVGVFGAVYRPASFLLSGDLGLRVRDYVDRAGGAMRSGDKGQIFVVRANGSVIPKNRGALNVRALPGDVIFVPVKTQKVSIWAKIAQLSSIVFQFGLSAAAFIAVAN